MQQSEFPLPELFCGVINGDTETEELCKAHLLDSGGTKQQPHRCRMGLSEACPKGQQFSPTTET